MPDKFVFPGGAVDADDLALDGNLASSPRRRAAAMDTSPELAPERCRSPRCASREETGLVLGRPEPGAETRPVPPSWRGFFAAGHVPHTAALRLFFRAITPPGRPRRFDARFFLAWRPTRSPGAARTSPAPATSSRTCNGSTCPPPAGCRCRSSPRWCCRRSPRSWPSRGRAGPVLPPAGGQHALQSDLTLDRHGAGGR